MANIQKNRFFALFDNINVEDNSNYKPVVESEIVKNEPIEKNVDIVIMPVLSFISAFDSNLTFFIMIKHCKNDL